MLEEIKLGSWLFNPADFLLIAGPCVIESEETTLAIAEKLQQIAAKKKIKLIFKASFDKANRTSLEAYRGLGFKQGLEILTKIKNKLSLPILTDIHLPEQAEVVAQVADVLQIPAFLCRQTDLLLAAAHTGKAVNIKKGQFMAPTDMQYVVEKIAKLNNKLLITERGFTMGYNNLVVDMRSLAILNKLGYPVIFDATHSVQLPGGGEQSGGEREFIPVLARAATAVGINGIFLETHPEPDKALSDKASMLPLSEVSDLLEQLSKLNQVVKSC